MIGTVSEFDFQRGLGTIVDAAGVRFPFHCVSIANETRMIDVGVAVTFEPLPKLGVLEAGNIRYS
jgi:hypothetical protein